MAEPLPRLCLHSEIVALPLMNGARPAPCLSLNLLELWHALRVIVSDLVGRKVHLAHLQRLQLLAAARPGGEPGSDVLGPISYGRPDLQVFRSLTKHSP